MSRFMILVIFTIILSGCAAIQNKESEYTKMPKYVEKQPAVNINSHHSEGSLWSESNGDLFGDIKAKTVGDILTIVINEASSSKKSSKTNLSSESSASSGLTKLLGAENGIFHAFAVPKSGTKGGYAMPAGGSSNDLADFGGKSTYKGSGENSYNDSLAATITARVIKVLPNHRLFIRGEKQIFTNGDEQKLVITGIVDRYQISNNNMIDSSLISDAKIFYNGKGLLADTKNRGWLAKLWELIRPF